MKLQYQQHMYKHCKVLDRMKTVGRETHAAGPARFEFRGAAGGRAYGRHRLARVDRASRHSAPLHSRRLGPAKRGGDERASGR